LLLNARETREDGTAMQDADFDQLNLRVVAQHADLRVTCTAR
jgi:hypothetical protein